MVSDLFMGSVGLCLLFVDADPVLFQQVVEGGAADLKEFGRPADVVAGVDQGPVDGLFFGLVTGGQTP